MLFGNTGIAFAVAFPAGFFNQPRGREFFMTVHARGKHRQLRMHRLQGIGGGIGQHRVFEETAGIADQGRIRQLAGADAADGFGQMYGLRLYDAHRVQLFRHPGVGHFQRPGFVEAEFDGGNHPLIAFAFEARVAVAERALGMAEAFDAPAAAIKSFHGFDEIAHFHTVGADVLDRAGADRSGNQRHILQAVPAARQGPMHQFIPEHAGFGADQRDDPLGLREVEAGEHLGGGFGQAKARQGFTGARSRRDEHLIRQGVFGRKPAAHGGGRGAATFVEHPVMIARERIVPIRFGMPHQDEA